jgi:hypothetical protein
MILGNNVWWDCGIPLRTMRNLTFSTPPPTKDHAELNLQYPASVMETAQNVTELTTIGASKMQNP